MPKDFPNKYPKYIQLHCVFLRKTYSSPSRSIILKKIASSKDHNLPLKFRREKSMEDDLMNLASSSTIKALMPLGNIVVISWFIEAHTRGGL